MEEDVFKRQFTNCGEIQPLIDELEDNPPDKRTKEWKLWKDKINFLFELYNTFAKHHAYQKIK